MSDLDYVKSLKTWSMFLSEGFFVPLLGTIGIVGNVLSIAVLAKRNLDLKPSFANLLITLCVFDSLFVLSVMMFYTLPMHSTFYDEFIVPYLTPFLLPLIQIVLTGSVYTVIAVALERFFLICRHYNETDSHNGWGYIVSITLFSLLFNLNKFFEVRTTTVTMEIKPDWSQNPVNVTRAVVSVTDLKRNPDYKKAVILLNFVVMVVCPLVILTYCHVRTYRTIRANTTRHNAISKKQRRDNAMAMLFFIIIFCFVLCHSGKFVINMYEISRIFNDEEDTEWPVWAYLLTRVNHTMLVFNSSVNFFIYCFRDAKFRQSLFSILGLRRCYCGDDVQAESPVNQPTLLETNL